MDIQWTTLTLEEYERAVAVGLKRQSEAKRLKCGDRIPELIEEAEAAHITGALGESACAKILGLPWDGLVNTFKRKGDIGIGREVRTRTEEWHDLFVRDDDGDEDTFFLMYADKADKHRYGLAGWMLGKEAKQSKWRKNPGGYGAAFFVPKEYMHDIADYKG